MEVQINLTLKEVQKVLCKQCKAKVRALVEDQVKSQIANRVVKQALGEES
jgi:uncharacterized protein with PIN domain